MKIFSIQNPFHYYSYANRRWSNNFFINMKIYKRDSDGTANLLHHNCIKQEHTHKWAYIWQFWDLNSKPCSCWQVLYHWDVLLTPRKYKYEQACVDAQHSLKFLNFLHHTLVIMNVLFPFSIAWSRESRRLWNSMPTLPAVCSYS